MGGSSYDRSWYSTPDATSSSGFHYSDQAAEALSRTSLDPALLPRGKDLICSHQQGIIVALDVTGSMGDSARVVYDKLPMFFGQIDQQGYLHDFAISFGAVGDTHCDNAPLQVCDFATGTDLDTWISRLYLEGGGGGQTRESYEMMAYYYSRHATFTHPQKQKPFLFFIGDEGFYDTLDPDAVSTHFGDHLPGPLSSAQVFREMMDSYRLYMLHVPYNGGSSPSDDQRICGMWKKALGEHFLHLREPKSVIDVMLGIIALVGETRDLDGYLVDMRQRLQTDDRVSNVQAALGELSQSLVKSDVGLPDAAGGANRAGKTQRL